MGLHKIRIGILTLTPRRKSLFLQWALEGFKFSKTSPRMARANLSDTE